MLHSNSTGTWTESLWTWTQSRVPWTSTRTRTQRTQTRNVRTRLHHWSSVHLVNGCNSTVWFIICGWLCGHLSDDSVGQISTTLTLSCLELVYMDHNWWGTSGPGVRRVGSESRFNASDLSIYLSLHWLVSCNDVSVHGNGRSCLVTVVIVINIVIIIVNRNSTLCSLRIVKSAV